MSEKPQAEARPLSAEYVPVDAGRLDRIEAKLDTLVESVAVLIQALAEEDEDDQPTHDLEGNPIPRTRADDEYL
jgi:hypothetical protein